MATRMIRPALLDVLCCASCGAALKMSGSTELRCSSCDARVPVRDGIPRFVDAQLDSLARRTQESFGYEWTHFADWTASGAVNFEQYFSGLDLTNLRSACVLDAGCGMGRHARMIAPYVRRVVAVDFSAAIEQAARNTKDAGAVDCIQADITALPLADASFDFVYSMGVLHHLRDTAGAIAQLVRKVKPGGRLRVYLYWKHHGWRGALLAVVSAARAHTTRLPHPLLRPLCFMLSVALTAVVVWPYRLFSRLGMRWHESLPLFVYARYPFTILYNDQFDRLSAPLEQRFDAADVRRMLEAAGLRNVTVEPRFGWIGQGIR